MAPINPDPNYLMKEYQEHLGFCSKCGGKVIYSHTQIPEYSQTTGDPILHHIYQCESVVNGAWWKAAFFNHHDSPKRLQIADGQICYIGNFR